MKKFLFTAALVVGMVGFARGEDAYFKAGPLSLTIPFKTADVVYLYDGINQQSLVGGETPIFTVWQRVSGTVGVVTSLEGMGTPFVGADVQIGNAVEKILTLGDIRIGGFGGYNFNADNWIGGVKASVQLW